MADLVNLGIFEKITGLVIGRPYKYPEEQTKKQKERGEPSEKEQFKQMVLAQCFGTNFPILFNVDIGHTDPILTIPLNALASLDSERDEFALLEAGVAGRPKKLSSLPIRREEF